MKHKMLIGLLAVKMSLLAEAELTHLPSPRLPSDNGEKNSSFYLTVGEALSTTHPFDYKLRGFLNISFGQRRLNARHAWDYSIGTMFNESLHSLQFLYGQGAYLFYPFAPNGFYLGAGVFTAGEHFYYRHRIYHSYHPDDFDEYRTHAYHWNPLCPTALIGYQAKDTSSPQFIQLQFLSAYALGTVSYGVIF